ncbi:MAG: prephenate dehydrogenase/arogenate dehydrogenase family protein [Tissierellia bacterium]|nr:prephenate dehydrogenase/arogenate dehydrogenase family protein [Tissierellia bacterium]
MIIGIVGLGLIGGSFAKATKAYTAHRVYGIDTDKKSLDDAIKDGSVDRVLDDENIKEADILLIALNPSAAVEFVKNNRNIKGILIDLCGVKRAVSEVIVPLSKKHGFKYIGGHPMAGREVGGYQNSIPYLFQGTSMILLPHGQEIESYVIKYFKDIGFGQIKLSEDDAHDRIIAFTSQMAHVVSNAYVKSATGKEHFGYSTDSLKDLTRVATLDEKLWTELFMTNRDNLVFELDTLISGLMQYRNAIDKGDYDRLEELLKEGKEAKTVLYPKKEG